MARGNIFKRKSTATGKVSYQVRVELPPDPKTGKRRQGAETFKTRETAQKRLNAWLQEIERGTVVLPEKITVSELFEQWMASLTLKPTSGRVTKTSSTGTWCPASGRSGCRAPPVQVQSFWTT